MADWIFTTPTVEEAPFAWNPLMERFRMPRGISLVEVSPCVYKEVRYDAYTNELGAVNLGGVTTNFPEFWPQPQAGLHYFRGGYEHVVDDEVKACLIASGLVDESNFTPANLPSTGFGFGGFGEGPFGG
ncbi:hypothetical protein HWB39_gp62 [Streptomyces phage WRightOn]|jgi:hypothetical protein|uniref:Uncharacterized protein n=3 Tax=Caudoviricetes TaxID=2731619 RepID=A0A2H4PR05_9CAUD|nr:hypothetical protein HWB39_gp62 [Streptomyces phage WRightOn]YP_009836073.1 hypothetical protein HWB40_gp61 [Streptomyces phage Manuel]ATW62474.1 hypothetical protein SEA_WRIGHTON_40 [Streptomyces phage WRightOn]ATW69334.1 hypothetical protein SEA_MANUEL_36 [Streptomyces phage Manuel]UVD39701.1 hypothetical protein SEA_ROSEPHARIE_37 [Streptomyces phage RosePharie]